MKIKSLLLIAPLFFCATYAHAQLHILGSAQNGANNAANNDASNAGSNAVNNTVKGIFGSKKKAPKKDTASSSASKQSGNSSSASSGGGKSGGSAAGGYKAYANYDFVPGDTVIFTDDFADDQDGEFPAHWNLDAGQGILNKVDTTEGFCITEVNNLSPGFASPRMKTDSYLTGAFTVEFDYYANKAEQVRAQFKAGNDIPALLFGDDGSVKSRAFKGDYQATFPGDAANFKNKWHHCALIVKNGTIKCYIDQYRILVIPNIDFAPTSIQFGGYGVQTDPIIIKNVRIASGGNMNSVAKKFTDSKIVTHGINFDIGKASIKPESMGTLNMIVKVMTNNPDLNFEIDGHTDNTGTADNNLQLSQQRAEAVKKQLVSMGISASRLTTKGFGDTKPLSDNGTEEGKANNRRVEFVKV